MPTITPGTYVTKYRLNLREGVGFNFRTIGVVPAGESIEIIRVKELTVTVWGETKKGWICIYMNRTFYIDKESEKKKYDRSVGESI